VADETDKPLSLPTDFVGGALIRRRYNGTTMPTSNASFTSAIAAASFFSETLASNTIPEVADNYYYEFVGYFKVDYGQGGVYSFQIEVNDCVEFIINDTIVCSRYSSNGSTVTINGSIALDEGYHRLMIRFFEGNGLGGNQFLNLNYKPPGSQSFVMTPPSRFFYDSTESGLLKTTERIYTTLPIHKSIKLNESTLVGSNNKSLWQENAAYKVGDYVYINNNNVKVSKGDCNASPNWEPLPVYYYCIKTHLSSMKNYPTLSAQCWVIDQCSRTLNGCRLRFGTRGYLPFGGFPGTEEYSIQT
jgi:hypothetical protein